MGLDMYLHKKTYVKNWDHMKPEKLHDITVKKGGKVRKDIKKEKISEIVEEVAYWRKANAIHHWMVENVQGGNDDCGDYYVSRKDMKELLEIIEEVLTKTKLVAGKVTNGHKFTKEGGMEPILEDGMTVVDSTVAEELLPSASGFFFGSTHYDEYYIKDLEYTRDVLKEVLKEEETDGDYYYSSSW